MPASRRVSQRQLEVLLAFAEANKDIALGRCMRGPQASQISQRAWETIANKLNSVADGVTKTPEQWRRYWVELKAKTKAKAADIRRNASRTGGGPNKLTPLNELEERILQLIGRVCVEGLPGVQIPFPIPSETTSIPPPQPSTSQTTNTSASQASPSTSQMEVEWLEDEDFPSEMLSSQLSLPISHTGTPAPIPPPSPPPPPPSLPQSSHTQPQPQTSTPPQSLHHIRTPSPEQQRHPRADMSQSSPRRHSRQRLIRNRDVPQWARSLEERRLAVEERHMRALEALTAIVDRRLAQIENRLQELVEQRNK